MSSRIIHVDWRGFLAKEDLKSFTKPQADKGLYQIYGHHPVSGFGTLLYIGCTIKQTFGERIPGHKFLDWSSDSKSIRIYVGRLIGSDSPNRRWDDDISAVEKLLIYVHNPARNAGGKLRFPDSASNLHVMNWGDHGSLLPEVSGSRWSGKYNNYYPPPYGKRD
jgi:hypothetical protein